MGHGWLAPVGTVAALLAPAAAPAAAAPTPPTVLLPNVQISEGDGGAAPLVVDVALDRPNPYPHPVSVAVHDYTTLTARGSSPPRTYGTATPGRDYAPIAPFRLEWAPGRQIASFPVSLLADEADEADENINVRVAGPAGGVAIGDNDVDIVLGDNDPLGTTSPFGAPRVLLPNAAIREPDAGCAPYEVSLQLARPNTGGQPVSVLVRDYTTTPVPGSVPPRTYGEATPGSDYAAFAPFRLAFAPGASAATFAIGICGDTLLEGHEEIDVRVAAPAGVSLVDNDLDLVLRNDDG